MSSAAPSTDDHPATGAAPGERPQRRIFGRRLGPRLRAGRRRLLAERLPALTIALPPPGERLIPSALFGDSRPLWLEIGFGGGEHLAAQAAANPCVGILGVEPFINGVARLIDLLEAQRSDNARILVDDARLLMAALPDAAIARAFVLFPDPWPKTRHHKRRFVNRHSVAELARIIAPGGELRLATDHADYRRWMLEAVLRDPAFEWAAESAADWRTRPADWPPTRYEAKAIAAGRPPVFLRFRRSLRHGPDLGI